MTKNQIEYAKLQETKRSNLAQEALTSQRDAVSAEVARGTLAESKRHNVAYEAETHRHNVAVEDQALRELGVKVATLEETKRANLSNEEIKREANKETKRSNLAREAETHRANVAGEAETHRSNVAREQENYRHNRASEGIQYASVQESVRHNTQMEGIQAYSNTLTWERNLALNRKDSAQADLTRKEADYYDQKIVVDMNKTRSDTEKSSAQAIEAKGKNTMSLINTLVSSGAQVAVKLLGKTS